MSSTVRLTMTQALVRFLMAQRTLIDGKEEPLFPGVFAIFGHGNVTCLSEALEAVKDEFPTWRGQNEQSMALAAIGYAKARRRRQIMVAATSIGPGALNLVTAAGTALANRLPVLLLSGDTFNSRRPDPVLQQVEQFHDPTVTVNDAFKPVVRYWDRITHPEQIISSLPQAVAVLVDPAACGPAFIALPQDIQEIAFDYPTVFFAKTIHHVPRPRPDRERLEQAVEALRNAKRPLLIAGGGVRYSFAEHAVASFAERRGVPLAETIAGKSSVTHHHPAHVGPIGIIGSASANELAAEADVILAIGTRLQDFTTGSWTAFAPDAQFVSINAARWDAVKHRAIPVVGDARETVIELEQALGDWKADPAWMEKGKRAFAKWNETLDALQTPTNDPIPTYAQIIGMVNAKAGERDCVITAAGGLPGETTKNWRVKAENTFDCEFGFSNMGYEIAAGWGAAMADPTRTPIVLIGDGTYMMMNSDIYSSVLSGHKFILIVCDNGGYAVINRLQIGKGAAPFNNLIRDCRVGEPFPVDFAKHAEAMGALTRRVESIGDLGVALDWAQGTDRTTVLTIVSDAYRWSPGDAWWDVGVPEVSERPEVRAVRAEQIEHRKRQRVGI